MLSALLLAVAATSPASAQTPVATAAAERYQLLRVAPSEIAGRRSLLSQLGFDHMSTDARTGEIELVASPLERAALAANNVRYRVVIDDLETYYASRLTSAPPEASGPYGTWLTPPFAQGVMGGYYSFTQVESVLDQIAAAYPSIVAPKVAIGTTSEGRKLWMVKISDNPGIDENEPETRFDAMHHAREPGAMQVTLWFMLYLVQEYGHDPLATYLVNERELYFVPVVNPDGYAYNQLTNPAGGGLWRKNRRNNGDGTFGVDPNRNWPEKWGFDNTGSSPSTSNETYRGPSAGSELEIQAMVAFCLGRQFSTSMSAHTYGNLWMYPYGYAQLYPANNAQYVEITNLATVLNGYTVGPPSFILYLCNGVTIDYEHNVLGTMSWTAEFGSSGDGFWPPTNRIIPLAQEGLLGFQRTALAAGAYVHDLSVQRTDVGDGDGYFEPGEHMQVRVTARNSGRAATSTPVVVGLSTTSTAVQIISGSQSLGNIASFAQASNNANPLELAILPNAVGGTSVDLSVTLAYEGYIQTIPAAFTIGEPVPFLRDDVEVDLGWTKGLPGDTATTGKWVRGDPIGTNNGGQPCNPEDDATPAPGVQCMVTGNGGGSAGTDDVDGGFTTLISPAFDLSGVGAATLSYARWYADMTVNDDALVVELSNNDGQTWAPLETVPATANAWTRPSFLLSDVLPQTSKMRLRVTASDFGSGSLVEAGIDDLEITIFDTAPRLNVYGKPLQGAPIRFNVTGQPGDGFAIVYVIGAPGGPGPFFGATKFAGQTLRGTIPASKLAQLAATVPSGPAWAGKTLYFRAGVGTPSSSAWTNWASITVQ